MLLKNVCIENNSELLDVRIKDGVFTEIAKGLISSKGEEVIDLTGKLILPPLVESHIHLDTALTVGDPDYNHSGTLYEGIALWAERKKKLSKKDVKDRALRAINMEIAHGVQYVRSHVDICDNRMVALEALLELKEEISDKVELQLIGFPQEGILSYPNGKELVLKAIELGVDGIGAIPHYEFTREYSVESLNFITEIAARKQILVDVHCDETDDDSSRGLETLAARTAEIGNGEYVTASHTTAMHSYSEPYMGRLMRVLQKANLNFVANPLVNTNLQGRYDSYPKRRGVTRVNELIANGLNVSFGQDDIRDPWYPMGNGNLRDVVFMGLHVLQLTGYEDIQNSYKFITHNGAKTLHLKNYGIRLGNPANFIVYDATSYYDALTNNSKLLYSVHNGNFLVKNV